MLSYSTAFINKVLGIRKHSRHLTEKEIRQILKRASLDGIIGKGQDMIHQKVFYFSGKKAKHLMTHRMDIEWIDINLPPESLRNTVLNARHSRLVCCRENLDNYQGILYVREYLSASTPTKQPEIRKLMVQPPIIPESADAPKILDRFRNDKIDCCIVVNEYGTLEGIITLHDILEH